MPFTLLHVTPQEKSISNFNFVCPKHDLVPLTRHIRYPENFADLPEHDAIVVEIPLRTAAIDEAFEAFIIERNRTEGKPLWTLLACNNHVRQNSWLAFIQRKVILYGSGANNIQEHFTELKHEWYQWAGKIRAKLENLKK